MDTTTVGDFVLLRGEGDAQHYVAPAHIVAVTVTVGTDRTGAALPQATIYLVGGFSISVSGDEAQKLDRLLARWSRR